MNEQETEKRTLFFKTEPYQGYVITAWQVDSQDDAVVTIERNGTLIRSFAFPAYKIWNIEAHANDIIESEIEKNTEGYMLAGSDGLGGNVFGQ